MKKERISVFGATAFLFYAYIFAYFISFSFFRGGIYLPEADIYISSYEAGIVRMWVFAAAFLISIFAMSRRRTLQELILSVLLPIELCCFLMSLEYILWPAAIILTLVIVFTVLAAITFTKNKSRNIRLVRKTASCVKSCFSAMMIIFIPISFICNAYVPSKITIAAAVYSIEPRVSRYEMCADNKEKLMSLKDAAWTALTENERLEILKLVADIETAHLGCASPELICTEISEDTAASYSYEENSITINRSSLRDADAKKSVSSILHEVRHCYQNSVCQMVDWDNENTKRNMYFEQAYIWNENFKNYHVGAADHSKYYEQPIEVDARAYADDVINEYNKFFN